MRTFQITQNFGGGTLGFLYLDIDENATETDIKNTSVNMVKKDYDKRMIGFFGERALEKPTLVIKEYDTVKHKPLKDGMKLKTRWR